MKHRSSLEFQFKPVLTTSTPVGLRNTIISTESSLLFTINYITGLRFYTASTTVRFLSTPDRSTNSAQQHRRPIISCDCRTCMEQSSYQHHSICHLSRDNLKHFYYQILPISLIFLLVICVLLLLLLLLL